MDHLYDYYKRLPREETVGGFIEFTGGYEIDDDFEVDDRNNVRAEIYGAADRMAKSATTIDEGILRLFGDDPPVDPRRVRAVSEETKLFPASGATKKSRKKRTGGAATAESFSLGGDTSTISPEEFSL